MTTLKSTVTTLAKAVGIYKSKSARSAEIADEIAALELGSEGRETAVAQAEEGRRQAVLSGDPIKIAKAEETLTAARQHVEHSAIVLEGLQQRFAEATKVEAEAARCQRYEEALAAHADYLKEAPDTLRRLQSEATALVKRTEELQQLVIDANADRPAGREPIPDPDLLVRGRIGTEEKVLEEKLVELWCWSDGRRNRVSSADARLVQAYSDNPHRGYLIRPSSPGSYSPGALQVELRKFRRTRIQSRIPHIFPDPLAEALAGLLAPFPPPSNASERSVEERYEPLADDAAD